VRPRVTLALLLVGCGGYIGTGAPPTLDAQRNLTVQIAVSGDRGPDVERALDWVLGRSRTVKRVKQGGELQLALAGKLAREKFVLGTDCTFTLRASTVEGDPGETRSFVKKSITGNLEVETERLITDAVVWALERAAQGPIATHPVEAPPEPVVAPSPAVAPAPAEEAPSEPAPKPKRGRPRRRL